MSLENDIDYIEFRLWKAADKNWSEWQRRGADKPVTISGLGVANTIAIENGPYDGDADGPTYVVVKLTSDAGVIRHFKKTGYYSSYDGTDWDGAFVEVFPKTKTITTFEEN